MSKLILFALFIILSIISFLTVLKYFLNKIHSKSQSEKIYNFSLSLLITGFFLTFTLLNIKSTEVLREYYELSYKLIKPNFMLNFIKVGAMFIGLSIIWLFSCFYISKMLSMLLNGKRDVVNEIANDNYPFFIILCTIFVCSTISFLPVFELFIRTFLPDFGIPFYR